MLLPDVFRCPDCGEPFEHNPNGMLFSLNHQHLTPLGADELDMLLYGEIRWRNHQTDVTKEFGEVSPPSKTKPENVR